MAESTACSAAIYWIPYSHLPDPGWAIAIIAVAAAAMSVHNKMEDWQKFIWLVAIGALLVAELRAIEKDHVENQQRVMADRTKQDAAFEAARVQQNKDFTITANGLTQAIGKIQQTLEAAHGAQLQTRPHAFLIFDHFNVTDPKQEALQPKVPYRFDYYFTNRGTETATQVSTLIEVLTGISDDKTEQVNLSKSFNEDWDKGMRTDTGLSILPDNPSFRTLTRTFTEGELSSLADRGTYYYLIRFEYSDSTGRWRSDTCGAFQRNPAGPIDANITHHCLVFERSRYNAPKFTKKR